MDTPVMRQLRLALISSPAEKPVPIVHYLKNAVDLFIIREGRIKLPWRDTLRQWAVVKQTLLVHIVRNKKAL